MPQAVDDETLCQRLEWYLREPVLVAGAEGVRLVAHPDDPPVERLRGTARPVNRHAK